MLPSLLARDIQQGLQQFLVTGFEPSDDFLHGLMSRFVADPSGWLKGPYLQVGLPFTPGTSGRNFFNDFETEYLRIKKGFLQLLSGLKSNFNGMA